MPAKKKQSHKPPKKTTLTAAPPDSDHDAKQWTDDVLYVSAFGKYALKRKGHFAVEHPVAKDGAYMYLVGTQNFQPKDAKFILSHVRHQVVETVDCNPKQQAVFTNADDQRVANSYVMPWLKPKPGEWRTIHKLLTVLVQGDEAGLEWLLNWFAAKYQAPGVRSFTSVTIIGPPGVGKSSMGELFALVLGKENTVTISGRDINEQFNSQFATRLWVVVNEVVAHGERSEVVETLKTYHTEERITLRTPHAKRITIQNRMSLWLAANLLSAVRLESGDDRRYTVFLVPSSALTKGHMAMVKGMYNLRKKQPTPATMDEVAAFAHDLKQRKVDWGKAQTPFANAAREMVAQGSRPPLEVPLEETDKPTEAVAGDLGKRDLEPRSEPKEADTSTIYKVTANFTVERDLR